MNTKEAIQHLESKGFKVYSDGTPDLDPKLEWQSLSRYKQREKELVGKKLFRVWKHEDFYGIYTSRELISFAKNYHNFGGAKQYLKQKTKSKRRARTRQAIETEHFDDIAISRDPKDDDIWRYY